ncbi:MAG: hypothetical protein HOA17_09055 [Candidatus Melainabacteria bacterium]|nr:hypothetical protein [Candidatus Melainabacteria bacterium]
MLQNLAELQKSRLAINTNNGYWERFVIAPCANKLLQLIAGFQFINANHLRYFSLLFGMSAAYFFVQADPFELIAGAVSVQVSFIFASMSGQLASLRQESSGSGTWLNYFSDRFKTFLYISALTWGFFVHHSIEFYISFAPLNKLIDLFFNADTLFAMPVNLQLLLMAAKPVPAWFIWPLAFLAFLFIDFLNQDSKGETTILKKIYAQLPILKLHTATQLFLISLLAAFDMVLTLLVVFTLIGGLNSLIYLISNSRDPK